MLHRRLITLSLLFVFACGGSPAPKPAAEASGPAAQPAEAPLRTYPPHNGPRLRVAIASFTDEEPNKPMLDQLGWREIAPVLEEQLITELVRTSRVTVLERKQLKKVAGEIDLAHGEMAEYFAKSEKVEKGKFLMAQAMFVGAVTEFEPDAEGVSAGAMVAGIGASVSSKTARVGIELRLVDTESGAVIESTHATGTASRFEGEAGISYFGLKLGAGGYYKTPLGRATREALDKAVDYILEKIGPIPWQTRVVSVEGPERVIIRGGQDINLKPNDSFEVLTHAKELMDPTTGNTIGYIDAPLGKLTITEVQPEFSIGRMDNGRLPAVEATVRSPGAAAATGAAAKLVATTGDHPAATAGGSAAGAAASGSAGGTPSPAGAPTGPLEVPTYFDVTPLPELSQATGAAPADAKPARGKKKPAGPAMPKALFAGAKPDAALKADRIVLTHPVEFDLNSAMLTENGRKLLDQVAFLVAGKAGLSALRIEGHTDNTGEAAHNLRLSEARARAVRNYLVARGLTQDKLQYAGFGSDKPVADNRTEAGRQKNRRVDFIFQK